MNNLIGKSLGRYHILEQLGEGGMAVVYKALDTRLDSLVAIKIIKIENLTINSMERALKRFKHEARALAQLTHPSIVKVMDYGEHEGRPYLVMPYFPGGTLKQKLGKPIPYQEAARLLLPIAYALSYAHEHNLIHRDVKPANVLLTDKGQPLLSDFGIAKVMDDETTQDLTGTRGSVGTPEYMSPEQAMGKTVDHRSDVYSLGIVLYEMVTGRRPFEGVTPMEVVVKQSTEPVPPPRKFVPGLPVGVEQVLLNVLAKNPAERYMDMGELTGALEKLAQGATAVPKASHALKRNFRKGLIGGISVVLVLTVAALAYGITTFQKTSIQPSPTISPSVLALSTSTNTNVPVTISPTETAKVEPVPSATITFTPTPEFIIGSTKNRQADNMVMVYVPAGDFLMGSDPAKDDFTQSNEQPQSSVYLDAYWIDQTEITNGMYQLCVKAGECKMPRERGSRAHPYYYGNEKYDFYPVINIDWRQAKSYCAWVGADLPTEAQWEKAARGVDGRIYPWGNSIPDCNMANYWWSNGLCVGDTVPVRNYANAMSVYSIYDTVGNVSEWTNSLYKPFPYDALDGREDPFSNDNRVFRGGSWYDNSEKYVRSAYRYNANPGYWKNTLGFRCAQGTVSP